MPTLDLTPAALAAQARELVESFDVYDWGTHRRETFAHRIAAALGAVRDAVRAEYAQACSFLKSCPWCGEEMQARPAVAQITHLVRCGDDVRQANREHERREETVAMCEHELEIEQAERAEVEGQLDQRTEEVQQLREALERDHGQHVDLVTALIDIAEGKWPAPDDGHTFNTGEFAKWMQTRAREVLLKHRLLIPATEPSHG